MGLAGAGAPFLAPLSVRKIPGIGEVTERALRALGIETVNNWRRSPRKTRNNFRAMGRRALSKGARRRFLRIRDRCGTEIHFTQSHVRRRHERFRSASRDAEPSFAKGVQATSRSWPSTRTLTLTIRTPASIRTRAQKPLRAHATRRRYFPRVSRLFAEHRDRKRKIRLLAWPRRPDAWRGAARPSGSRTARTAREIDARDGQAARPLRLWESAIGGSLARTVRTTSARSQIVYVGQSNLKKSRESEASSDESERMPYTSRMSLVTPPSGTAPHLRPGGRLREFWQRISEGRRLDELWSQFSADARASYGFYMKEADSKKSWRTGAAGIAGAHREGAVLVAGDETDAGAARASVVALCSCWFRTLISTRANNR